MSGAEGFPAEDATTPARFGQAPIPMTPPRGEDLAYQPLPGLAGRFEWLEESLVLSAVETPEGFSEQGEAYIEFDLDGSASDTFLYLDDESGRTLVLHVLPLVDVVRIRAETS